MPLFLCSKCGVVENTDLCGYWSCGSDENGERIPLCSKCDPRIGEWHGRFKRHYPKWKEWAYKEEGQDFIILFEKKKHKKVKR